MAKRSAKGGEHIAGPAAMKSEVMMSEGGEVDGRHAAAQDVLAAMAEKSPIKMVQALANFMDLHHAESAKPEVPEDA